VQNELSKQYVELPPSPAMAGIYTYVDSNKGVWKAPANESVSAVVGPDLAISNREQESLNIDAVSGKSINVIRTFPGYGTLVWGARTLNGNDNEWRYISVRRFFNMVEESVKKSSQWAVFEPNTISTWVKIQAMIENYLFLKWREGALAGSKPEQAFFVNVGLGTTMTSLDILEGRLNVEIGMAVARPAEFIVLKFSQLMQQS
jgi:phage tail sheath protein FI